MSPTSRCAWVFGLGVPLALLPAVVAELLWVPWAAALTTALLVATSDALRLPKKDAVRCTLVPPAELAVGRAGVLRAEVHGAAGTAGLPLQVRLDLEGPLQPVVEGSAILSDAGTASLDLRLLGTRRGRARVCAVWLRWESPLGLFQRSRRFASQVSFPVVLDVKSAHDQALRFLQSKEAFGGVKAVRFIGDGTEFEALREYAPGFDPRSIDWRASARHRKLLSRDFRAERNHPVLLAVDSGRLMAEPVDGVPRLDRAAQAAIALALVALKTGDRAGFYSFDERPRLFQEPKAGMRALRRIQLLTADLEYSATETNFTLGLLNLHQRIRRRSLVVLFTDFVDHATAQLLVENTERLARRHLVVFVTIRDPLLVDIRDREPRTPDDVHRAVVADDLLADRARVLRRLQRIGVHCVEAPWQTVSAELLNHYFEIKRRELIG